MLIVKTAIVLSTIIAVSFTKKPPLKNKKTGKRSKTAEPDFFQDLDDDLDDIDDTFDSDDDVFFDTEMLESEPTSQNLLVNYTQIMGYVIKNHQGRDADYFRCGLKDALFTKGGSEFVNHYVFNLIFAGTKGHKNDEDKPKIRLCNLDKKTQRKIEVQIMHSFSSKNFLSGYLNYHMASCIIQHYHLNYSKHLAAEASTLHVLRAMFDIELSDGFKHIYSSILGSVGYSKHKHINRALSLNSKLKCIYKQEFTDTNGFFFDDLTVYQKNRYSDAELEEEGNEEVKENSFQEFSLAENEQKNSFLSPDESTQTPQSILRPFYWHFYYPREANPAEKCLSCSKAIEMAGNFIVDLGQSQRGYINLPSRTEEFIVTEDKLKRVEGTKRVAVNRVNNQQAGQEYLQRLEIRAEMGDINARYELAQQHYFGNEELNIPVDRQAGYDNFQQAARRGHHYAEGDVGLIDLEKIESKSEEEKKDIFASLLKAARKGVISAINAVGHAYETG